MRRFGETVRQAAQIHLIAEERLRRPVALTQVKPARIGARYWDAAAAAASRSLPVRKCVQSIALSLSAIGNRQGVSPLEYLLFVVLVTAMTLARYG